MYVEHCIPRTLQPFLESFWSVTAQEEVPAYPVLPDGCVDILFSTTTGLQIIGTMTKPQRFRLPAKSQVMGIRFRPGVAAGLLPMPLQEITDRSVPLDAIWPVQCRELNERFANISSVQERLFQLSRELRLDEIRVTALQKAIDAIVEAHGQMDLDTLARKAGLSLRQLRRRFREYTGLSPKLLCRILRFRDALSKLDSPGLETGAQLAAHCGYYDQAHFIDDFREFSGSTPKVFLRLRPER